MIPEIERNENRQRRDDDIAAGILLNPCATGKRANNGKLYKKALCPSQPHRSRLSVNLLGQGALLINLSLHLLLMGREILSRSPNGALEGICCRVRFAAS